MIMKKICLALVVVFFTVVLASCDQPFTQSFSSAAESENCQIDGDFTSIDLAGYQVKMFNPNDLEQPDIWEGPVCIVNTKKNTACSSEISLIKSVRISNDEKYLLVNQFSGSNETIIKVAMDSCELSVE